MDSIHSMVIGVTIVTQDKFETSLFLLSFPTRTGMRDELKGDSEMSKPNGLL